MRLLRVLCGHAQPVCSDLNVHLHCALCATDIHLHLVLSVSEMFICSLFSICFTDDHLQPVLNLFYNHLQPVLSVSQMFICSLFWLFHRCSYAACFRSVLQTIICSLFSVLQNIICKLISNLRYRCSSAACHSPHSQWTSTCPRTACSSPSFSCSPPSPSSSLLTRVCLASHISPTW